MIPGIDPRIDIAFKKVLGSEPWRDLTASLINAVLEPPQQQRLVEVELLNPYSEKMTLDDKVSILDIKAQDGEGRLYHKPVWTMSYRYSFERRRQHRHQEIRRRRPGTRYGAGDARYPKKRQPLASGAARSKPIC